MATDVEFARGMVIAARQMLDQQVKTVTLDEALFAAGGWRSGLGVLKHVGAWLHVYHSYAFEAEPKHWADTDWPRGLVDEVELSPEYLGEVIRWIEHGLDEWSVALDSVEPGTLDQPRPVHWGGTLPLATIVGISMFHISSHLGELNMLLSIKREEAWEWGEEVEENHIDTFGHGTRASWMTPDMAAAMQEKLRLAHEARESAR